MQAQADTLSLDYTVDLRSPQQAMNLRSGSISLVSAGRQAAAEHSTFCKVYLGIEYCEAPYLKR